MSETKTKIFKGGAYLLSLQNVADVVTPEDLNEEQRMIAETARDFAEKVHGQIPALEENKRTMSKPLLKELGELGLLGLEVPEAYGGMGLDKVTTNVVLEEMARSGAFTATFGAHTGIGTLPIVYFGTEEQKKKYLPRMATGEVRGAFSMSEPGLGSDVAAVKTKATKTTLDDGADGYRIDGQKMWLTNGGTSNLVAVLAKTDEGNDSVYKNMTTFLVEKEPGFGETAPGLTIPGKLDKMGYKGVETTEAVFEGHQVSADQVLGGATGQGFYQMMDGVEVGRVNVAARAVGIANRAFELAIAYAQQRETFGKPIAQHQAILFRLAEMATKVETAHAMMVKAARLKDRGERNDVEAGMAKMIAAEYCNEVVQDSFRIHGGYGYSKEYEIERLYREAAFMLIGEGTSDIQKMIIGRSLLKDYQLKG